MSLNNVPVLPPVENSSFDHLAFYNSIMNDTTLGLSLESTNNVSPTMLPDSDFMFADKDPSVTTPPRSSATAAHNNNTASLAAFLEPCKAYRILTEQEYQDTTSNKQFLSQKLAGLEAELECETGKKINLCTNAPTTSMVTSAGKADHHQRKPLFSRKLKFKTQANDNPTVSSNINSHEIAEVNQRIQKLNTEILELVREVKDQELQLLQHQAAVLAAAYEQTQQAAQWRPQSATAKATTRMKNYSAQPADSAREEENDKAVIDGLILSLKECIQVISGIPPVPASFETPDQSSEGGNRKFVCGSNEQVKTSSNKISSAAITATPAEDTVTSKLRTLLDITQQVTLELSQLRRRVITAEKTSVAEIARALGAAEQVKTGLQWQHLQEIQQLKQAQLAEIERVQAAFDALSTTRVPAEQQLSVNILQREFKAMMREKLGSSVATNGVA